MNRPFLRWVGGKQRYALTVSGYFRDIASGHRYYEPFVGGASVFFSVTSHTSVMPQGSVLGDANADLMNFYSCLAEFPIELWSVVSNFGVDISDQVYYDARVEFNGGASGLRRAALFLLLNRCGFNGIWRVNRRGEYNVPFGKRRLYLPLWCEWLSVSRNLAAAQLVCADYRITLATVSSGDCVYLDPPYFDSTGRELFARYTLSGFSLLDHEVLANEVDRLTGIGAKVVITIRDDPIIRSLYEDYKVELAGVSNCVGARGSHAPFVDLIIRNFD